MTENTRCVLQKVLNDWQGKDRHFEDWQIDFDHRYYDISFSTFRKYAVLEEIETLIPISLEELVVLLNDCAGNDCYGCSWEYIVQDGQAFERVITYRLVNINFN